jgi:hypothetical protein
MGAYESFVVIIYNGKRFICKYNLFIEEFEKPCSSEVSTDHICERETHARIEVNF